MGVAMARRPHKIDSSEIQPGALHKRLGYAPGAKIPASVIRADLAKAKKDHDVKAERQDVFALNARRFDHTNNTGHSSD